MTRCDPERLTDPYERDAPLLRELWDEPEPYPSWQEWAVVGFLLVGLVLVLVMDAL